MKTQRRFLTAALIGAAVVVILCFVGAAAGFFLLPSLGGQLPAGTAPLVAHISAPQAGDVPAAQITRISVSATSTNPLTELQLWVNGRLIASQAPPAESLSARMSFDWLPHAVGPTIVIVRAIDAKGYSADSAPLRLTVGSEAVSGVSAPVSGIADEGESLDQISEAFGFPPEILAAANPDLDPSAPLAQDTEIVLPIDEIMFIDVVSYEAETSPVAEMPEPAVPAESQPPASVGLFTPFMLWLGGLGGSLPTLPAAPQLAAAVNGCSIDLTIIDAADTESGFFLYEMSPGSPGFERVGEFGVHSGEAGISTSRPALLGSTLYKVAAFNGAGEAQSAMISINIVDTACGTPDQQVVMLSEAHIELTNPADRAYCYASPDSIHWNRLPSNPLDFYTPVNNVIDLTGDLAPLGAADQGHSLALECWGWSGTALTSLGRVEGTVPEIGDFNLTTQGYRFSAKVSDGYPYGGIPVEITEPPLLVFDVNQIVPPPSNVITQFTDLGIPIVSWSWTKLGCFPAAAGQTAPPCAYVTDIEGFHIYSKSGQLVFTAYASERSQPATWTGGEDTTECYSMTAFMGDLESQVSAPGCAVSPAGHPLNSVTDPNIAAPHNVELTEDGQACMQHIEGILMQLLTGALCEEAAKVGQQVLVWDWSPETCWSGTECTSVQEVDGFAIYELKSGQWQMVDVVENTQQTVSFLPPSKTAGEHCYMVRAYKGFNESPDSALDCAAATVPAYVSTGPSKYVGFTYVRVDKVGDGGCSDSDFDSDWFATTSKDEGPDESVEVGYYRSNKTIACDKLITLLFAGGVGFPIEEWANYPIESATLEFDFAGSVTLYKGPDLLDDTSYDTNAASCLRRVYQSNKYLKFWYESNVISTGPFGAAGAHQSYDVRQLLQQRVNAGDKLFRIVLVPDLTLDVPTEGRRELCQTGYKNFRLNVTFGDLP